MGGVAVRAVASAAGELLDKSPSARKQGVMRDLVAGAQYKAISRTTKKGNKGRLTTRGVK